jgi:hypothetical protein
MIDRQCQLSTRQELAAFWSSEPTSSCNQFMVQHYLPNHCFGSWLIERKTEKKSSELTPALERWIGNVCFLASLSINTRKDHTGVTIKHSIDTSFITHTQPEPVSRFYFWRLCIAYTDQDRAMVTSLRMKTVGKLLNCFLLLHLKYENGKAGHENEHELTKYREFRKLTNSSRFMSNTVDIRKLNTEYRPVWPSAWLITYMIKFKRI